MKTKLFAVAVFGMMSVCVNSASAATFNYNLSNDWSTTQNPNGVWSLNSGSNVMTNPINFVVAIGWDMDGSTNPSWTKRIADQGGWNDVQVGDVIPQAWWYGAARTNVTWTSPNDGTIDISGKSWDAFGGRDGDWTLDLNGNAIATREHIIGLKRNDLGANFADNLLVGMSLNDIFIHQGDVIMFSVGGISTSGVELNINYSTPVPIPSAIFLFGSGIAGLVGTSLKRKK